MSEVFTSCPKCGGDVWDNRERIKDGKMSPKAPKFSCKDKDVCKWALWPPKNGTPKAAAKDQSPASSGQTVSIMDAIQMLRADVKVLTEHVMDLKEMNLQDSVEKQNKELDQAAANAWEKE